MISPVNTLNPENNLQALFAPRSIAVVGASSDIARIRGKVLRTLVVGGFAGSIYPVNPSHAFVQDLPAFKSVLDLPKVPDLALIAVAAEFIPQVLEECAQAGIGAAVVFSAASTSADNGVAPLHHVITEIAQRTGMRILGPNTEGFYNVAEGVAANFSIVVEQEAGAATRSLGDRRGISIISHSGGLGYGLYSRARLMHLPVRHVVATGNESDVDALAVADYLINENKTSAILMFIEGLQRPEQFARIASTAADAGVPIIVMKVGRSAASQRAAVSHTGHLTGTDTAYDAVFRRYGVIRVSDPDEMIAIAAGFCQPISPKGNRVCVLTGTGGTGAWVADLCAMQGADLPEPDNALKAAITQIIPDSGAAVNPIDVTASIVDDRGVTLAKALRLLAAADYYDSVVLIFSLAPVGRIDLFRPQIEDALRELGKPVFFVSQTEPDAGNVRSLADLGIQNYSFQGVANALRALDDYRCFRLEWSNRTFDVPNVVHIGTGAMNWGLEGERSVLMAHAIPLAPDDIVSDPDAACVAAARLGYPVAVKICSADIPHKTEAGGVILGLNSPGEVREAYARITESALRAVPGARIDGMQIQKMASPGVEMVVGAVNDADFGPILMLGFGGIFVEVLRDTAFEPTPLGIVEARSMIGRLNGVKLLQGPRGKPPSDIEALAELLVRLSGLLAEHGSSISEVEFNPVFVHEAGKGVTVVDTLIVPSTPDA